MAVPPRHIQLAARCERDRPHAFSTSDRARLHRPGHSSIPLHGGGCGRERHPLRSILRIRYAGASDAALAALKGRKACLLANHGVIATGADLPGAILLAGEVENLALQYTVALSLGEVRILDDTEMSRVIEKFRTYGQQNAADPDLIFGGAQPGAVEGS